MAQQMVPTHGSFVGLTKQDTEKPVSYYVFMHAQLLQSCPTLCNARDCSPPGSSVHGISPARILEWVAISSCRGVS